MAVAELIVSRRALLGAACVVPFVRHPGLDPGSISFFPPPVPHVRWTPDRVRGDERATRRAGNWQSALARFRNAEAALAAAQGADDIVFDRVLGRFNHALRRLLRAPAPDPAAFSAKLALAIDQEIWELTGGEACLAALARDARRLARPVV
jgi:hypothetical protein